LSFKLSTCVNNTEEVMNKVLERIKEYVINFERISPNKVLIRVDKERLREVCNYVYNKLNFYYCVGVLSDERAYTSQYSVYHVFTHDEVNLYIIISSSTPNLTLPSITREVPPANWSEREAMDLFGVIFEDHPDPRRLVKSDDFPEKLYPYRKDYKYNYRPCGELKKYPFKGYTDVKIIEVSPHHPLFHEHEDFIIYVKNDEVIDIDYRGFYNYRGIEKIGEARLTIDQIPFLAERICGICGFAHSCAYCQAIEETLRIEVSERVYFIRTLMLELERIHSHMLWIGLTLYLTNYVKGFVQIMRVREEIMNLCEEITGNRKMYGINLIGTVRRDLTLQLVRKIQDILSKVEREFKDVLTAIPSSVTNRLRGIGILSKENARKLSVVGPTARGSGIKRDVRVNHPYAAYREVSFNIPTYSEGDVYARFMVRVDEVFESINICRQVLDKLPRGEVPKEVKYEIVEKSIGIGSTEAPRGENIHFVIIGREKKLLRWRVRAPTYANLQAIPHMTYGQKIHDVPLIIASIDPCLACTDRAIIIDVKSGKWKSTSMLRLVKMCMKVNMK